MEASKRENDFVGDVLLNIADMEGITDISQNGIRVALCRGTFPMKPIKLGNRLRWRASDVRAWMESAGSAAAQ